MMRRYLTTCLLITIIAIVVAPSQAQNFLWSGGVSVTEMTPQSGIFFHIDALRDNHVIGSWFSTAGVLPTLVKANGLTYNIYGDFPGISKIEKVVFSPDSGKTQWPAIQVEGKGWCVPIPMFSQIVTTREIREQKVRRGKAELVVCEVQTPVTGLSPGGYGIVCGVWSRDKSNKIRFLIFSITTKGTRNSNAASHTMVQQAPTGFEALSDQVAFAYLRGFVPAWASPDPAVLMQQQMVNGGGITQPQSSTQPQAQTMPEPEPTQPVVIKADGVLRAMAIIQPKPKTVKVTLEVRLVAKKIDQEGLVHYFLIKPGEYQKWDCVEMDPTLRPNQDVRVWRQGQCIADAKIKDINQGIMTVYVVSENYLQVGDSIQSTEAN